MADYPVLEANLAALERTVLNPTDTELANKLAAVDRQTRQFILDYLSTKFDEESEKLKADVVDATTLLGKVRGSTFAGEQRDIVQGSLRAADLAIGAVATERIADGAVTAPKLGDGAVTSSKLYPGHVTQVALASEAVTTAKLAAGAVTASKLYSDPSGVAGAVSTDHVQSNAITASKIARNAVTGEQIVLGDRPGQVLVTDANNQFRAVSLYGGASIDASGRVGLLLPAPETWIFEERFPNGVDAGPSEAVVSWAGAAIRGASNRWALAFSNATGLTHQQDGKLLPAAGVYLIECVVPAHGVGKHLMRVARYREDGTLMTIAYGTAAAAAAGVTTCSVLHTRIQFDARDYMRIEHYTENAVADKGLGQATGFGADYEKYTVLKITRIPL